VVGPLGLKMVVGEAPQLLVDQWNKGAEGLFITLFPALQELSDLSGLVFGH
jgi:hypothetical protein